MIEQPFRVLFPAGVFGMLYAVSLWAFAEPATAFFWHGELMTALFLLPVGCGFLLYTVPRFFSGSRAGRLEVWFAVVAWACMFAAALLRAFEAYLGAKLVLLAFLVIFILRRYPASGKPRPIFTPFLVAGFTLGFGASIAQAVLHFIGANGFFDPGSEISGFLADFGRLGFQHGFFWVLFTGIGIRLFPMLMLSTHPPEMSALEKRLAYDPRVWTALAWSLAASYLLEALELRRTALVIRALATGFVAWQGWLLGVRGKRRGVVPVLLKLSLATALGGQFALIFFDAGSAKHVVHLVFGAGLGMGTMLIMTRVLLAHEGGDLQRELDSRVFAGAFGAMYLTVLFRASLPWTVPGGYYLPALAATGSIWMAACVVWFGALLVYIRRGT